MMARRTFTLIELMVTVTLISVALAIAVTRMDDLTVAGRLRSAARQLPAYVRQARLHARTRGVPALIVYHLGEGKSALRLPQYTGGVWQWAELPTVDLGRGIIIDRVLIEGKDGTCDDGGLCSIRVDSSGRCPRHAVVLRAGGAQAVVLPGSDPRSIVVHESSFQAVNYQLLLLELREHEAQRPHAD